MTDKRPFIILGITALIVLFFFVYFSSGGRSYSWIENYKEESKEPYGTSIIHELLEDYFPEKNLVDLHKSITKEIPLNQDEVDNNYIFIGQALYLDTANVNSLLQFVEQGNTAFISSKTIPYDLMFHLYYEECNYNYWEDYESYSDSMSVLNFLHPSLQQEQGYEYRFLFKNLPRNYRWQYIDSVYFCEQEYSFAKVGTNHLGHVNFAKKKYGKGTFYLHTTPLVFTNIQMLDKLGLAYVEAVLSHLQEGDIYWDKFSRTAENIGRRRNQRAGQGTRGLIAESPLKYILQQNSLAWAWYLFLALALVYLLFRAKRRQRIIPVKPANTNTSMEFISTIGRLYFIQNDHKKLSIQKMKLFLSYVREHYNLATKNLDQTFIQKLSAKSEIPETVLSQIVRYYTNIKSSNSVSEQTLIDFHLEMDKFYKHCK